MLLGYNRVRVFLGVRAHYGHSGRVVGYLPQFLLFPDFARSLLMFAFYKKCIIIRSP